MFKPIDLQQHDARISRQQAVLAERQAEEASARAAAAREPNSEPAQSLVVMIAREVKDLEAGLQEMQAQRSMAEDQNTAGNRAQYLELMRSTAQGVTTAQHAAVVEAAVQALEVFEELRIRLQRVRSAAAEAELTAYGVLRAAKDTNDRRFRSDLSAHHVNSMTPVLFALRAAAWRSGLDNASLDIGVRVEPPPVLHGRDKRFKTVEGRGVHTGGPDDREMWRNQSADLATLLRSEAKRSADKLAAVLEVAVEAIAAHVGEQA